MRIVDLGDRPLHEYSSDLTDEPTLYVSTAGRWGYFAAPDGRGFHNTGAIGGEAVPHIKALIEENERLERLADNRTSESEPTPEIRFVPTPVEVPMPAGVFVSLVERISKAVR